MLNKLKQTGKQAFIYSLGNLSAKVIGLVLLPLYTSYLTTEEYGILAILEVISAFMVAVLGFKLSTAMMRWSSNENSTQKTKAILFTTFVSAVIILAMLNLTLQPLTEQLSNLFFGSLNFKDYFVILIVSASFEILNLFSLDLLRLKEKPIFFVTVSMIRLTVILVLNVYFVKYQGIGVVGIILSQLIGNVVLFLITLPFLIKNMVFKFLKDEIKPMLRYSIPLIFSTTSMMLLTMGDRFLIKYYLNYSEVGVYSLGYKLASVMNMLVIQSFQNGFLPIAYKNYDKPDAQRFFSKTLTYYSFILVLCGLGLSLFSEEVIILFSKNAEFNIAYTVVPFIALAFVFKGIQYVYSLGLHFAKKTKYNASIVMGAAIINLGLNVLLIPNFGIYGAAIATIITWVLMSTAFYHFSYRFYKVKYEIKKIVLLILIGIALYMSSLLFHDFGFFTKIFFKTLLIATFPIILFVFGFYEKVEIERVKAILSKFFSKNKR